jgi:XapX domain-containing protein
MARILIGFVLSFLIGAACRYFDIPAASPPVIPGALIVLAMTLGYSSIVSSAAANMPRPRRAFAEARPVSRLQSRETLAQTKIFREESRAIRIVKGGLRRTAMKQLNGLADLRKTRLRDFPRLC